MVTIIIPVYNVSPYIHSCIESIMCQSYVDLEVILVDDGSTDGGADLVEREIAGDDRFRVIRQKNKGVSAARNKGLSLASGEWVLFMDADDTIAPDWIASLVKAADQSCDVVMANAKVIEIDGREHLLQEDMDDQKIMGADILQRCFAAKWNDAIGVVWNKLIKRSLIAKSKLRFVEGLEFAEDGLFTEEVLLLAQNLSVVGSCSGYVYQKRPNSAVSKWSVRKLLQGMMLAERKAELARKSHVGSYREVALAACYSLFTLAAAHQVGLRDRFWYSLCLAKDRRLKEVVLPYIRQQTGDSLKNKYFNIFLRAPMMLRVFLIWLKNEHAAFVNRMKSKQRLSQGKS